MVWARTKLLIWDYIFEPVTDVRVAYAGKHPGKFYKKINELIRSVLNVPDGYIQEKSYNWEKTKDGEKFEIAWEVTKVLDVFSYIVLEIDLSGFSVGEEGKASIRIRPRLITEYPQDTIFQQNLLYEIMRRMWHRLFYHRKRMEYLNFGKELVTTFESTVKRFGEGLNEGTAEVSQQKFTEK
ncbi:MAG: hypothetical protein HY368_03295 [Candidatus Aenigmarchaeota archaeon]|nr:hypothetical protein [Candidatus Aenigmarchaeota archaeon]